MGLCGSSFGSDCKIGCDGVGSEYDESFRNPLEKIPDLSSSEQHALDMISYYGVFEDAYDIANIIADFLQYKSECCKRVLKNNVLRLPTFLYGSVINNTNEIIKLVDEIVKGCKVGDINCLQQSCETLKKRSIDCETKNKNSLILHGEKKYESIFTFNYSIVPLVHSTFWNLYYQAVVNDLQNIYTGENIL